MPPAIALREQINAIQESRKTIADLVLSLETPPTSDSTWSHSNLVSEIHGLLNEAEENLELLNQDLDSLPLNSRDSDRQRERDVLLSSASRLSSELQS